MFVVQSSSFFYALSSVDSDHARTCWHLERQCMGMSRQVRSLKQKVVLLLDKSATDDSLIAALRSPAARLGAFASSATISDQALCTAGADLMAPFSVYSSCVCGYV